MANAPVQAIATPGEDDRRALIAAALEQATQQIVQRVHATADKREQWQASLNDLLRRSGRDVSAGRPESSAGVMAITPIQAGAERLIRDVQALSPRVDDARMILDAVAAAAGEIRGRTGRAIVHDLDRVFLTARNCLLETLDDPREQGPLEEVVTLAEHTLKEEHAGHAAFVRLLREFNALLDGLADSATRDVAYAVLANLAVLLLTRLVRELVEELTLLAGSGNVKGHQAAARVVGQLESRIQAGRVPPVRHLLRIVVHDHVHAYASGRAKASPIATLPRHQLVLFLEKRKKMARVWWIEPAGDFRIGWLKANYLKEL